MNRSPVNATVLCALVSSLLAPRSAAAQEGQQQPGAAPELGQPNAPRVQPPRLLEFSEATYPDAARTERREATVVLRLSIDVDGAVTAAEVTEGAGHGFDEAAREAALRFRFEPATRDGQRKAARILYRYEFRLPPEPAPTPPPPPAPVSAAPAPPSSAARPPRPVEAPSAPVKPVEVTVRGALTEAQRVQQSAEAVTVVDTRRARQQSSDLGEIMTRTQGVVVLRSGGLGSGARFSLNGLYDDQIRFLVDGVPLELAGYPFGIANVPVNLVERIDIYRGVVPGRFGADALGGAVNLITNASHETGASVSYQISSFATHRATLKAGYRHDPTGFVVSGSGFLDVTRNDYRVDVQVDDERGRGQDVKVRRFHDDYLAYGGSVELGFVDRPWARRLLLRGFVTTYDKELQHNIVMTRPYGEVTYGETVRGVELRYEQPLLPKLTLDVVGSYANRVVDFEDLAEWRYDWFGRRLGPRLIPGEIEDNHPIDQMLDQHSVLGRATLSFRVAPEHTLRLSLAPTVMTRTGESYVPSTTGTPDAITARRDLVSFISGVEYELNAIRSSAASSAPDEGDPTADFLLQNLLFAKHYAYHISSDEVTPDGVSLSQDSSRFGLGDSMRLRLMPELYVKASYEFATRLPRVDEVFGNGVLIAANLGLKPEVSHNGNIGPRLELRRTPIGELTVELNAFWRDSDRLIALLGNDRLFTNQNVYQARALGVENTVVWSSPGRWVSLDESATFQDVRNVSSQGQYGNYKGDRIPNRPWFFASWGARVRIPNVPGRYDTIEPFYLGRYTHEFFRGWESQGLREFKQVVDAQLTHNLGISWLLQRGDTRLTSSFEVQNFTDARAYDLYGVQRPGRAFFFKATGDI